ncbi:unnamed protein product [Ranitomeya imitator]|uniref:Uncharacterized protein n=1 Tax=Ranitomeya imitator TaxID=111125 RepID=A0ABN9MBH6_9NEOB|nr:unnamed protein product [Ranitomeya imitator]
MHAAAAIFCSQDALRNYPDDLAVSRDRYVFWVILQCIAGNGRWRQERSDPRTTEVVAADRILLQRYRQRCRSLQRRCLVSGELSHRQLSSDQRCRFPGNQGKHRVTKRRCEVSLGEFLKEIKKMPESVKFAEMANILVIHCQSSDDLIQLTAMSWMREFLQLAGRVMLPYSSGILTAVLPCLSYDDRKKSIKEVANVCNLSLMKLVTPEDDESDDTSQLPSQEELPPYQEATDHGTPDTDNDSTLDSISVFAPRSSTAAAVTLNLDGIVQVLDRYLHEPSTGMMTRICVLKWLYHLYIKTPRKMFRHTDLLFPILLKTLSDESDEVSIPLWSCDTLWGQHYFHLHPAAPPAGCAAIWQRPPLAVPLSGSTPWLAVLVSCSTPRWLCRYLAAPPAGCAGIAPRWLCRYLAAPPAVCAAIWQRPLLAVPLSGSAPCWLCRYLAAPPVVCAGIGQRPLLAVPVSGTAPCWLCRYLAPPPAGCAGIWHRPLLAVPVSGTAPCWLCRYLAPPPAGCAGIWQCRYEPGRGLIP